MNEYIVLAGLPTKTQFLEVTSRGTPIDGEAQAHSSSQLWEEAKEYFSSLQATETGAADVVSTRPLPTKMRGAAEEALRWSNATRRHSNGRNWSLVEIDRLAIYQKTINFTFTQKLRAALPTELTEEATIGLATNPLLAASPVAGVKLADNAFAFLSDSSDIRLLDAVVLDPSSIHGYAPRGRPSKVITLFVGAPPNLPSALKYGDRLLLFEGYHRAFTLRSAGATHMPCLVESVSCLADLTDFVSTRLSMSQEDIELFLDATRPALFKDFFDGRMIRRMRVPPRQSLLNVQFSANHRRIPSIGVLE